MECNQKNCPTTGTFIGNHQITFRTSNPLHIRFGRFRKKSAIMTGYKMAIEEKIHQNMAVHLGSNCLEFNIIEAIRKVMSRDWSHLKKGNIGQIFVPKIFLSKYPEIIDFEKFAQESQENNKINQIKGEMAERKVFDALKKFFNKQGKNDDVLIIRGLKFMKLKKHGEEDENDQDEIEDFEKDFLIINLTKRYVMSLEVKLCLSTNSLRGGKKQINGSKTMFDEWLGATFTKENGWVFLGVMCFDKVSPKYRPQFCESCRDFVIIGIDEEFESKFENMVLGREFYGIINPEKAEKEFLEAAKHLVFFAAFDPVITCSARLTKQVSKDLSKAGSAENIEVYRCLTPDQLPLLKANVPRVMFLNAPSTGKTTLMTSEACYLATEMNKPVLFCLPGTFGKNRKTLLTLNLENQFENITNLEVYSIKRRTEGTNYQALLEKVKSPKYINHHIFIDEIHIETNMDLEIMKEISRICVDRTLWLTVTSMNPVFAVRIKSEFADEFYFPEELVYPIRNSSQIIDFAYDIDGGYLKL